MTVQQIHDALVLPPPRRTLQYRLKFLVDSNRLVMEGVGRSVRYRVPPVQAGQARARAGIVTAQAQPVVPWIPLSEPGAEIRERVRRPLANGIHFQEICLPFSGFRATC